MAGYTPIHLAYYIAEPQNITDKNLSPIVFLHGLSGFKEMWEKIPQVVANITNRKAYVIDQRNHGDTEWTDAFNFDILVDDLLHFLESNNIEKAIIIGHSMGGIVGINTALRRPDKVEALIVEDMFVGKIPQPMLEMLNAFATFGPHFMKLIPREYTEDQALELFVDQMNTVMPPGMGERKQVDSFKGYLKRDKDDSWTFKCNFKAVARALNDPDTLMSEPKGVYNGPACFIYGTLSIFYALADEVHIKALFPKAEFVSIEGASHNITGDCPEQLTESFVSFITSI